MGNNNTEVKETEIDDSTIDLYELFLKIKSFWYVCVIGILVGALAGVLYYTVLSTPKYQSTSMVYLRASNKKLSLESLQLNSSLTNDYSLIFMSRPNLEKVIDELHLKYNVDQLKRMIDIENPDETRILQITCTSENPKEAKNIANSLMEAGMDDIREIDSQEPYVVERGIVDHKRVGHGLVVTTSIAALLGLLIVLVGIIVRFVTNDSFTSTDDVERTLGLPVLATVAEDTSLTYVKLEAGKGKKHHGKHKHRSEKDGSEK